MEIAIAAATFFSALALLARAENTNGTPAQTGEQILPPDGYRLAWSDEFDSTAVDTNRWMFRADSKLRSTQLPQNVSVSNGCLRIELKKEKSRAKDYTGGGLISRETFKYGFYEARMRVPPGAGWHTSFWMMKAKSAATTLPGARAQEIDVVEQDSSRLLDYSVGVIDWSQPGKSKNFGRKRIKTPNLSEGFHVWGCEFTATNMNFYFDGRLTHSISATNFPHSEQNIWLTSIATEAVDDSALPAAAEFDWVRFYKKRTH